MDESKTVVLKQTSKYVWDLIAPKGHVMLEGLQFASAYKAEVWLKNYVSTWPTWSYKLVLKDL